MNSVNVPGCRTSALFGKSGIETLELVARAGFTRTFLNFWNETAEVEPFAKLSDKLGVEIETLHAPFDKTNYLWTDDDLGDAYLESLMLCVKTAAEFGIPFVVIHSMGAFGNSVNTSRHGIDRIARLVDKADRLGVKLAFENIDLTHPLLLILDTFKTDTVGFCYDVGHEHALTPGMRYMPIIGERLMTTHIQDNIGIDRSFYDINYRDDMHRIPFDGNVDFERISRDFAKYSYNGTLMLEVSNREDYNFYGHLTAQEYYERAYSAAKRLQDMCIKAKKERIEEK